MTPLGHIDQEALSATLRQRGLDGWLVYDFHDSNPVARRVLGLTGMLSRRVFLWLPAVGPPRAVVHNLDRTAMPEFSGEFDVYTTWQELHQLLTQTVGGRRIAMEISPENAVPYLDLVPAGVVELLRRFGATLVSSAPLVSQFASRWSATEVEDHRLAAEHLAAIARETLGRVVHEVGSASEVRVQRKVLEAMARAGLETEDPPIVAFGAHAANPHYAPEEATDRTLAAGDVVLLDLWGRCSPNTVWADQTWMGYAGGAPAEEVVQVWETVRQARDAVVDRVRTATAAGEAVNGATLDTVARAIITERGFGAAFVHRTGHSIDLELHGSGPHLDDFETHDVRELIEGVAFSVEPGVYLPGRFGVRSEINVVMDVAGVEVTPASPQTTLITGG
jgi:Xaa-Pro aminopeptidase